MQYLSLAFAAFTAILLLLYHCLPRKWNLRGMILLAGSLVFYCSFGWEYLPFLLFTALTTFACGQLMARTARKKLLFLLCVIINAAVWFAVKVLPWAVEKGNWLLYEAGITVGISFEAVIIPVGISYFTLQAIGYLADVYSGKLQPEKRFWRYLLFITYFPAIVQGPISRYDELMPELLNQKKLSFDTMRAGLLTVLVGLVKKMVIADRLAIFVDACFAGYGDMYGVILYLGAVGYAVQLYMDFSGCVDICRGVSSLFNVALVNNFRRPYLAASVKDFWSKWHISLSRWLKDYIYIPLGGNRHGALRKYRNLLLTFLVSGLWHGAGFHFFLWGILHAGYQILGQCTFALRGRIKKWIGVVPGSASERIYQTVITFNLVTLAWVFFRSPGIVEAIDYLSHMLCRPDLYALTGRLFALGVSQGHFLILLLHLCVFFVFELRTESQEQGVRSILSQHIVIRWVIYLLLILDVLLLGAYGAGYDMSGFMYGGF